jgi:actin related protein 2/3 complex, subunit 2
LLPSPFGIYFRPSSLDVQFVDYDGVRFHLSTPERKTLLLLSMHIRCWSELVQTGALDVLKREYGDLLRADAEPDYNVSLDIDLEKIPQDEGTDVLFLTAFRFFLEEQEILY